MHIDAADGPLLCTHVYPEKDKGMNLIESIPPTEGFHDIYLIFKMAEKALFDIRNYKRVVSHYLTLITCFLNRFLILE